MAEYLSPGVYVEEFESGPRPMEGVSTSTAGFVGMAQRGAVIGAPELVTNISDFKRTYGGYLPESVYHEHRYLAYAVEQFFLNGGGRAYIMRVAPEDAKAAEIELNEWVKIKAKNPGLWGNNIRVKLTPASKAKTQILEVIEDAMGGTKYKVKSANGFNAGDVVLFSDGETKVENVIETSVEGVLTFKTPFEGDVVDTGLLAVKTLTTCEFHMEVGFQDVLESYEFVSLNVAGFNYIGKKLAKSVLVSVEILKNESAEASPYMALSQKEDGSFVFGLYNGSDGDISAVTAAEYMGTDDGPGKRTGIQSFLENDNVSIMAVPGNVDPNVQMALIAHCENTKSRFAVLDIPRDAAKVADVLTHRDMYDSDYAAIYHPWLEVFDPLDKKNTYLPPSGAMMGIYARTDNSRGVFKAPANETVSGVVGLSTIYGKGEQDILNPKGVNLIRIFTGQGIRVWGARTLSSNSMWKYINVRRLFIFLEESIRVNTNWVVFEPNDEALWSRVKRTIDVFLTGVWRTGALAGTTPGEAFFVDIGRTTMSKDDIDNGRLVCVIGVAPVKPAEFVIFRITQKTSE
ncbi:phage tail sheath family protein [Fusibacter ferrireducens]|uniref:Phage tail sheath family protein n=1 Tax=Fusibacter ferrireducens TaxID=2785058 RepID=A0ABR9ZNL8_9FIRM|nr:phage tail sheath family protein [Fusibacter ferrireducens]MBF4692036.1 phage tail sheath family protein [Fusibacter ferrireducens]